MARPRTAKAPDPKPNLTLAVPTTRSAAAMKALRSPAKILTKLTSPKKPKQKQIPITPTPPPSSHSTPSIPTLQLHRASGTIHDPFIDAPDPDPKDSSAPATWTCCACKTSTPISTHAGPHPLGALACICPHKPCNKCRTSGTVKPFLPMEEPAMVPVDAVDPADSNSDADAATPELRFGIVCPACGLSWRAREFGRRWSKTLRKMPSVSLGLSGRTGYHHLVAPGVLGLRKSRSTVVLGNRRIVTPPGVGVGQAEYAAVRFSGVECSCGVVVGLEKALCFQIEGGEAKGVKKERAKGVAEGVKREDWEGSLVGWTTNPELEAKGHGTSTLRIRGVVHPNPLRSSPVVDQLARDSWADKCDQEGWN